MRNLSKFRAQKQKPCSSTCFLYRFLRPGLNYTVFTRRVNSEHSANIRIWITLHVPKIEDGNNFGVSVQEDTLAELRQVEAECAQYLDQISRYYLTRYSHETFPQYKKEFAKYINIYLKEGRCCRNASSIHKSQITKDASRSWIQNNSFLSDLCCPK